MSRATHMNTGKTEEEEKKDETGPIGGAAGRAEGLVDELEGRKAKGARLAAAEQSGTS